MGQLQGDSSWSATACCRFGLLEALLPAVRPASGPERKRQHSWRTPYFPRFTDPLHSPRIWTCFFLTCCLVLVCRQGFFARQANSPPAQTAKEQDLRRIVSKALNSLGVFYYEKHESIKAIETLEEALKYDPDSSDIRTNLAMMYLEQQQFEKVLEKLGSIPNLDERDQRALTALAVSNFVLGNYGQAVSFYKKLAQLQPNDQVLHLTLAVALHLNGESEESEKVRRQLPNDQSTQAQYHVILADALRFRSKVAEASAEYEKAIALAPDLPEVNYRLGVLQSELHDYEKAAESFRRELRISPNNPDANYSMGAYYLSYGNNPGLAKGYFEKTLQLNPQHLGAYLALMKIYLNQSQAVEALQLAEKAEELGSGNDEFHYLKSRALNLLGKRDLAEKELKIFEEMTEKKK
jgi:tetratricopeptide (TPR) repeat protein